MTTPATPQVPFNFNPLGGSLTDALNLLKKDVMMNLNAHHVGTVQAFDPSDQTASVTINYPKTYFQLDPVSGLYSPVLVNYPMVVDCPVICLGGGATALTFPIQAGDECLVLFNDRDLDNWFNGGTGAAVATPRLHSFSDAIILVGLRSSANSLSGYDMVRAVLQNGGAMVGVGPSLIKIANTTTTLKTLIQSLISAIDSLVTATAAITVTPGSLAGPSSPPLNATTISAVGTTLTSLSSQFAGLLE